MRRYKYQKKSLPHIKVIVKPHKKGLIYYYKDINNRIFGFTLDKGNGNWVRMLSNNYENHLQSCYMNFNNKNNKYFKAVNLKIV